MKLSEHMRLGATLGPQIKWNLFGNGIDGGNCALGAVFASSGVAHSLNNEMGWTREAIADYIEQLESLEAQQELQAENQRVAEPVQEADEVVA